MHRYLSRQLDLILWSLFSPDCPACENKSVPGGLCSSCQIIQPILEPLCSVCSRVLEADAEFCSGCEVTKSNPIDKLYSAYWLTEEAKKIIHLVKYQGRFEWLSVFMQEGMIESVPRRYVNRTLVSVPIHSAKFFKRGFNQSELLSSSLSKYWGLPVSDGLIKKKETISQSYLNRKEREFNLKDCFNWNPKKKVPKRVILVDDIATTGETLRSCARVLKSVGVESIEAWTLFRTIPPPAG